MMKNFLYLRKGLICFLVQMVAWLILSFEDYLEETYNNYNLWKIVFFGLPVLTLVLYFVFKKWIYSVGAKGYKGVAILIGNWIIVDALLGLLITEMTCNWNNWIVHQRMEDWTDVFNGIEYPLFAICYGLVVAIVILIVEAVILLINHLKKQPDLMADEKQKNSRA